MESKMFNNSQELIHQLEIQAMFDMPIDPQPQHTHTPTTEPTEDVDSMDSILLELGMTETTLVPSPMKAPTATEVPTAKVKYTASSTKEKYTKFIGAIPEPLLNTIAEVLKDVLPEGFYTRDYSYTSLGKNLLFVLNEFSKEKTISKDVYQKIQAVTTVNPLFEKDLTRNYSVGHKSQGYIMTPLLQDIVKTITHRLNLNTEFEVISSAFDCILIDRADLVSAPVELQAYLLPKIEGLSEDSKAYFCFNESDNAQNGRVYSTFSHLSKEAKGLTDTNHEIDMGTAVQSLMLSIVAKYSTTNKGIKKYDDIKHLQQKYPNVVTYTLDKANCRMLSEEYTKQSSEWVKKLYTIPCYGGNSGLTEYLKITKKLDNKNSFKHTKFVTAYTKEIRALMSELNTLIKKRKLPEDVMNFIDEKMLNKTKEIGLMDSLTELKPNEIKKKTVFYCIEYFEGRCRTVLKETLKNCTQIGFSNQLKFRDVHDAVYVNFGFDDSDIQQAINTLKEEGMFVLFNQNQPI